MCCVADGLHRPIADLQQRDWAHPCDICTGIGLATDTSTPGLGSPPPHLRRRLGPPLPHLRRDCARYLQPGLGQPLIARAGPTPPTSAPGLGAPGRFRRCCRRSIPRPRVWGLRSAPWSASPSGLRRRPIGTRRGRRSLRWARRICPCRRRRRRRRAVCLTLGSAPHHSDLRKEPWAPAREGAMAGPLMAGPSARLTAAALAPV